MYGLVDDLQDERKENQRLREEIKKLKQKNKILSAQWAKLGSGLEKMKKEVANERL